MDYRSTMSDVKKFETYCLGKWSAPWITTNPNLLIKLGLRIEKVIFNDPATIILWNDGTKTVVKCSEDDIFDPEKGMAMAICKKIMGESFKSEFKKFLPKEKPSIIYSFNVTNWIESLNSLFRPEKIKEGETTEIKAIEQEEDIRTCSECGKEMFKGFVIEDRDEYYCCDKCLTKHYTDAEYGKMYANGEAYYTTWPYPKVDEISNVPLGMPTFLDNLK